MAKGNPNDTLEFNPVGSHTQNGSLSSAVTLTAPDGATKILIQAFTQNVRYTLDGTVPTASKGFKMSTTDAPLLIPLGNDTVIKLIQETASASVEYQWGGG
jgi:hypothetical protein